MNDNNSKKKKTKYPKENNTIETLSDSVKAPAKAVIEIGKSTTDSIKDDLIKGVGGDIINQIFGPQKSFSGELTAGQTLEMKDVVNKSNNNENKQLIQESVLRKEEEVLVESRQNELRLELSAIMREVVRITEETSELADEVKIAAIQAPSPEGVGIYHLTFLKNFLKFLRGYRKKIESSKVWLSSQNKRANQKGWLGNYKKHGAKYLLSGEHYVARSSG